MKVDPISSAGFARGANVYDRVRPEYPAEAVDWALERLGLRPGAVVLDLAAGTGKLTRALVARGLSVVAIDPSPEMLARLHAALPAVDTREGTAEAIPLPDVSVKAVTVAQAFPGGAPGRGDPVPLRDSGPSRHAALSDRPVN